MISLCLTLRPESKAVFSRLNQLATTGDYNVEMLHRIRESNGVNQCRETVYYLASLYLQSGETDAAHELLAGFTTASKNMTRYFHVLSYSKRHGLAVPRLSRNENACLKFLDGVLNPVSISFESAIVKSGGFSVVGNAPGGVLQYNGGGSGLGTRVYFNSYQNNNRITDIASVHVVTPSWNKRLTIDADTMCITGNDIFYRRSRVWRKLANEKNKEAIYTVPVGIWSSLYKELGCSPSAGVLMLAWIEAIASRNTGVLKGYVAGFSSGQPLTNHSYDSVPASDRHNWEAETLIRDRLLASLKNSCLSLFVEA